MFAHFECFEKECFLVEDDSWFPWGDVYLCRSGIAVRITVGEFAGEVAVYREGLEGPFLEGINFQIEVFNGLEVEWIEGG